MTDKQVYQKTFDLVHTNKKYYMPKLIKIIDTKMECASLINKMDIEKD